MSEKFRQQYADAKGILLQDLAGNGVFATLAAAPTNSLAGYAKGCLFVNSAGSAGTLFYVNTGSATSSTWTNVI